MCLIMGKRPYLCRFLSLMKISITEKQIFNELSKANIYPEKMESFNEGTSRSTYKIKTEKDTFVLKLFNDANYNEIKDKITLLQKLSVHYGNILLPINHEPVMINGTPSYIYKYFEGECFSKISIKNKCFKFGKIVAELDIALQKISADLSSFSETKLLYLPKQKYSDMNINKLTNTTIKIFNNKLSHIDFDRIRKQYVHKDLHYYNVVYDPKNKNHLIVDTDGISIQYLPREIAVSVGNILLDSSNNFSEKKVAKLMSGYSTLIKLSDGEKKTVPLFIIQKKLGEIDYLYKQLTLTNKENVQDIENINKFILLSQNALEYTANNYDSLVSFFSKTN